MRTFQLLLLFTFFSITTGRSQCTHCTSLDEALVNPSQVVSLDLRARGLTSFPSEISKFSNLKHLNLSNNTIGEIPYERVLFNSLISLDLSNNPGFNALDIKGIGKAFPNLKRLSLASSSIRHISVQISELKRLEELDLSNNAIEFLPDELEQLKSLRKLNMSNNRLGDVLWIKNLWSIEEMYLEGNSALNAMDLGKALLYKDSLRLLTVTPENTRLELTSVYSDLNFRELHIVGGEISSFDNGIGKHANLEKLVLDGCEFPDEKRLFEWINRFKNLHTLEFRNMSLLGEPSQIESVTEIRFVNCIIEQKESLRNILPKINVESVNTDITTDGYVGNAQIATTSVASVASPASMKMSEAMAANNLEPYLSADQEVITISTDEPQKISLELSSYEIPINAFRTADGAIYNGEVTLKIKEYDNAIENALAGTPMVYRNSGSNGVFASSGMIDFRAYDDNGRELQPNPENMIQVEMRNLQPTESTNLYQFNEQERNWQEIGVPEVESLDALKRKYLDSLNKLPDADFVKRRLVPIGILMKYKRSRKDAYQLSFEIVKRKPGVTRTLSWRNGVQIVHQSNYDERQIAKSTWIIDTVITPEFDRALRKMKIEQNENRRYWKKKNKLDYDNAPRLITQLHISPNFEDDNYEMTFFFRDSLVTLPVLPLLSGSTTKIQMREKKKWADYERAKKKEGKAREELNRWKIKNESKLAAIYREQLAEMLVSQERRGREQLEMLRFGLSNFGLVNCDYFSRETPSRYLQYDTVAVDGNGNWVRMPDEVRNILLDDNSFVSTSSTAVPDYDRKKSIVLFSIGALEIAVVKGVEKLKNGVVRPIIERISTEGMSSKEVRNKVLSVRGE